MKIKKRTLEYWLLVLFIPVEAINGLIVNYFGLSFSPVGYIYRALLIAFFFRYAMTAKYCRYMLAYILMTLGVFININIQPYSSLGIDLGQSFRILYVMCLCIGLNYQIRNERIKKDFIIDILNSSTNILIAIYLLSAITHTGIAAYSGEVGYKAWFNSSNSLTIVMVILAGIQLIQYFKTRNKPFIIKFFILSIFLFLLGTKSGVVFLAIFVIYMYLPKKISLLYMKRLGGMAIIAGLSYALLFYCFNDYVSKIIERISYFIATSDSLIQYLFSGRNDLLVCGWKAYVSQLNLFAFLFGKGTRNMQVLIGQFSSWSIIKSIEMDFFDILFELGILGIYVTYLMVFSITGIRKLKIKNFSPVYILFGLCIIFSILAGHVFTDSFGSTILALISALAFYEHHTSETI